MIPHSKQPDNFDDNEDAAEERVKGTLRTPADFSPEELALAHDLQRLFPLEQGQLPPRFVQTLATAHTTWAAPSGLNQRVTYQVFRRLRLPRRLFAPPGTKPEAGLPGWRRLGRAPRVLTLSMLLALVVLSLVSAAPSFTQGLRVLLSQAGRQAAPAQPLSAPQDQAQYLSLQAIPDAVPFSLYWPGMVIGKYRLQGLVLHVGQSWADGPIVDIQYALTRSQGSGMLVVREFRPATSTILQVVPQGAWHRAQVGNQPAIYIDGQWVQQRMAVIWRYGTQSELLYQANGLIFWITADQRDGAGEALLAELAQGLMPLSLGHPPTRLAEQMLQPSAQIGDALSTASLGWVIGWIQASTASETGADVYIALGTPPESSN